MQVFNRQGTWALSKFICTLAVQNGCVHVDWLMVVRTFCRGWGYETLPQLLDVLAFSPSVSGNEQMYFWSHNVPGTHLRSAKPGYSPGLYLYNTYCTYIGT